MKVAAHTEDGACVTYIGELGSGNYVKMVHNGIEYGDMQLIAEVRTSVDKILIPACGSSPESRPMTC